MARPYSLDLRARVILAVERDGELAAAASRHGQRCSGQDG
jgi:hypothetical protein